MWDISLKNYEKESFLKIFLIFFIVLSIFSFVISYLYYKKEINTYDNALLAQMKEYNFNFQGHKFNATIIKKDKFFKTDHLYISKKDVFSLFYISKKSNNLLKIIYPLKNYKRDILSIEYKIFFYYIFVLIVLFFISLLYAFYAIRPMQKAIVLIEDFLKDIIHDINTPITTILLNTKYLIKKDPSDELERIEVSANRILSLYKNFEMEIKGFHPKKDSFNLYEVVDKRVKYFKKLYPSIDFKVKGESFLYHSDKNAFIRVIDNLISNACKYNNKKNPIVEIDINQNELSIRDNGMGIKNVSKVFDRFYKENDRGIGIGMNIVKKLCNELNIKIYIESKVQEGTTIKLTLD